jgi:uncharacterized protein YhbP (UPF0306 family)
MAGQLGHLLDAITLPSVTLGVIPFSADGRPMWTLETFIVFDDSRVHVELLTEAQTWRAWMPQPVMRHRDGHVLAGVVRCQA